MNRFYRSPLEVHESPQIQQELFQMYMRRAIRLQQKKKQKVKYKVGQTVRVQYKKEKMGSRSYNEQAGSQRYIITN